MNNRSNPNHAHQPNTSSAPSSVNDLVEMDKMETITLQVISWCPDLNGGALIRGNRFVDTERTCKSEAIDEKGLRAELAVNHFVIVSPFSSKPTSQAPVPRNGNENRTPIPPRTGSVTN